MLHHLPLCLRPRAVVTAAVLGAGLVLAHPILAHRVSAQEGGGDPPAVLTANEVVYDEALDLVVARGAVEIVQGDRILRADTVTYNERTGEVTASGSVILVQPNGDVAFAEYAELQDELATGFVQETGVLFDDGSRIVANAGLQRPDGNRVLERAVYSPCRLCPDNPDRPPLWQVRAVRVIQDRENQDIIYRDAFLDIFGVPVAYTPVFSHPSPEVTQRSGFLAPTFGNTSSLGFFGNAFYYRAISPSEDLTGRFGATQDAGLILGGEYRRRFSDGFVRVDGSINRSDRIVIEDDREVEEENRVRGHVFAEGLWNVDANWRLGANIERATDDSYLDVFDISNDDVLESRTFAEGFYNLDYVLAEAILPQDLRREGFTQAVVLPNLELSTLSGANALLGGRLSFDASAQALLREDVDPTDRIENLRDVQGVDTQRLSARVGWERIDYTPGGVVVESDLGLRGDAYRTEDLFQTTDPTDDDSVSLAARFVPEAALTASYPLVRRAGRVQQIVEPIVGVSARGDFDTGEFPNNDSRDAEFDTSNLFAISRFPGLDAVEEEARVTYGLRTGVYGAGGGFTRVFLGQSHRIAGRDDQFPEGSGLAPDLSDVVGRVTVEPGTGFGLDWRFRLSPRDGEFLRSEATARLALDRFSIAANHAFLSGASDVDLEGEDRQALGVGASAQLSRYWSSEASVFYDVEDDDLRSAALGLRYADECFIFDVRYEREFTESLDRDSGDSVFVTVNFRNLGALPFADGGTGGGPGN